MRISAKWLLAQAGVLHEKGVRSDIQYATMAVDIVQRIRRGRRPAGGHSLERQEFDWIRFPVEAASVLGRDSAWPPVDPGSAIREYGSFNMAAVWLRAELIDQPQPEYAFRWGDRTTEILREGRLLTSPWG